MHVPLNMGTSGIKGKIKVLALTFSLISLSYKAVLKCDYKFKNAYDINLNFY